MNTTFSPNWEKLKNELKENKAKNKNDRKRKSKENFAASSLKKRKVDKNSKTEYTSTMFKNQKTRSRKKSKQKLKDHSNNNESIQSKKGQVETSFSKSQKGSQALSPDIWFDDVDVKDIIAAGEENVQSLHLKSDDDNVLVKPDAFEGMTNTIGMAVSLVGIGEKKESVIARVSLVNQYGKCVYDKYVKPSEPITDYRTKFSGIEAKDLENGEEFKIVQKEVYENLKGRVLVGHSLYHSLKALFLNHPSKDTRDTAKSHCFRSLKLGRSPSLKLLCRKLLKVEIQKTGRDTVEDAQASMKLYMKHKRRWRLNYSKKQRKMLKLKTV